LWVVTENKQRQVLMQVPSAALRTTDFVVGGDGEQAAASANAGPSAALRMTDFVVGGDGEEAAASADAGPSAVLRMTNFVVGGDGEQATASADAGPFGCGTREKTARAFAQDDGLFQGILRERVQEFRRG